MSVKLQRIDDCRWRIPREGAMRTDGLVFASETMIHALQQEQALDQVRNVATLPGIVGPSLAMPDIHWGYGFPIGGVAAFDPEDGVVSPGGVGYDINCGVRLLRSALDAKEIAPHLARLADALFRNVPSGVGSHRKDFKLMVAEERRVLEQGARWAVTHGYGSAADLDHIEEGGTIAGADPELVSDRALERGRAQLGTLGSGNHFLEIQRVEKIFDETAAAALGLFVGQLTVSIHTGSRGLGYQVCDDWLRTMLRASRNYGIELPDKQLCCAPLTSPEGKRLPGRDGGGRQLRLRQPPADHRLGPPVLRTGPGQRGGRAAPLGGLRRLPQHCQVGGTHRRRAGSGGSASIARERPGPFRPAIRRPRQPTARSASRC